MVLFGGSILCGGDVLAKAMQDNIAKKYVIVGGAGHTTETLRIRMHEEFPAIETKGKPEAEVFAGYLKYKYDMEVDFLECNSTNCGNNITYLLNLLKENKPIIHLALSSGLSATVDGARRVADELNKTSKNKVYVIDSLCACSGQGLLGMIIREKSKECSSIEELVEFVEMIKNKRNK